MAAIGLAPGRYRLARQSGDIESVHVYDDGSAYAIRGRFVVRLFNLNDYLGSGSSESPPAPAGDGPREVLDSAGAQEGHGWSVSATRTIGNVPELRPLISEAAMRERLADQIREIYEYAAKLGPLEYRASAGYEWSPVSGKGVTEPAPPALAVEAPPSPGPCPSPGCYGRQRRERGEVRVRVWACGCTVWPEYVYDAWFAGDDRVEYRYVITDAEAREQGYELCWSCEGHGASASHPTEAGAVAVWREALAEAQREEDAR